MSDDRKLKDGWRWVRFGDVVRDVRDTTKDPTADGLTRVVGLDHLDPESLPLRRWDELDDLPDGTSFTRVFRAGQVLFGKRRAYQRKVAVADFDGVCSSDILVFEPSTDELLPEFLPHLVQSDGFFDHALGTSAGSLSPRTKFKELAKYKFAVPPVAEQQRISALMSTTRLHIETLDDVMASTGYLVRSLLAHIDGPTHAPLSDVADIQLGRQRAPAHEKGLRPRRYLRAANLKMEYIDFEDVKVMDFSESEEGQYRLKRDDILLVEGGDADKVGAPTYFDTDESLCFQNTIIRIRPHIDRVKPRYLYWALRAAFDAGRFQRIATGTKLYHLGIRRVGPFEVPLPPMEEQAAKAALLDGVRDLRIGSERAATRSRELQQILLEDALGAVP